MKRLTLFVAMFVLTFWLSQHCQAQYPDPDDPPPCWNKLLNDPRCEP